MSSHSSRPQFPQPCLLCSADRKTKARRRKATCLRSPDLSIYSLRALVPLVGIRVPAHNLHKNPQDQGEIWTGRTRCRERWRTPRWSSRLAVFTHVRYTLVREPPTTQLSPRSPPAPFPHERVLLSLFTAMYYSTAQLRGCQRNQNTLRSWGDLQTLSPSARGNVSNVTKERKVPRA